MRLIDANELIAEYDRVHIGEPGKARKLMEEAPTVDAVEVVRCKDCIHDNMTTCPLCWIENHTMHFINHNSDDFCSCGERRKEDAAD